MKDFKRNLLICVFGALLGYIVVFFGMILFTINGIEITFDFLPVITVVNLFFNIIILAYLMSKDKL